MNNDDKYSEIRPYNDEEVPSVIESLIQDRQLMTIAVEHLLPKALRILTPFVIPFTQSKLRKEYKSVSSIEQFQMLVKKYLEKMLATKTDGFSYSGIDKLQKDKAYLFISNHRDIALDPALVNWSLYQSDRETVRIAIGDNLLSMPCASHIMKLNKSFIVKRSVVGKEKVRALKLLSNYIFDSIKGGHHIWIAQQEGRAKDCDDQTDPTILKMFYMHGRSMHMDFGAYMKELAIVPVSISYESDPCDQDKAEVLYQTKKYGHYQKEKNEDIETIIKGLTGQKKRIHLCFGDVIETEYETPELLATAIDRQIISNYQLYPINYIAANIANERVTEQDKIAYKEKMAQYPTYLQPIIEQMYAMPAQKKQLLING